jgi:hypothetical protein
MSADPHSLSARTARLRALGALMLAAGLGAAGCGGGGSAPAEAPPTSGTPPAPTPPAPPPGPAPGPDPGPAPAPGSDPVPGAKSVKRGIAYDLATEQDLAALSPGVSWWYNWSPNRHGGVPQDHRVRFRMDFQPMLWNGSFDAAQIEASLKSLPGIRYLLLLNEPNLNDQSNLTPQQAAQLWPRYEAVAANTGVQLVGPAITWGTQAGFEDPVVWMDAFYAAYRAANGGRDPRIDHLAFHWYDYGLAGQLDRLKKYGKPFWVTEFANWHRQNDGAQIDSVAKQKAQMAEMVKVCEDRDDVFRYAWFTGRWAPDPYFTSLLGANGELTELGRHYLSLPFREAAP